MSEPMCLTCHVVHDRDGCIFDGEEEEYTPRIARASRPEYEGERIRSRGHYDLDGRDSWDVWA